MEAVGGSVLSTTLQVLLDRIALNKNFLIDLFPGNKKLQLKRLMRVLQIVSPVLEDADNKQGKSLAVKTWFDCIKHAVYQADDVLDEINTERSRIQAHHSKGSLSDIDFSDQFIGELSPRLEEICDALEKNVQRIGVLGLRILYGKREREDRLPTTSVVKQSDIFGRDVEKEKIIQMVLSREGATDVSVIPITGMGGVGKTTLAQLVYNDGRVKNHFETQAWVCVSEEFDVFRVTKDLLMEVNSSVVDEKDDLNRLQVKLQDNLEGTCFIIILDDIWNDNFDDCQRLMSPLNSGSRGSKIIVTTRNENIALMLQNQPFHSLQPIPKDQSWLLFKLHAFEERVHTLLNEFETIGRKIVGKCKGLPLAIKTVAGSLRSKSDIRDWRAILSSDNWMDVGDIIPALSLSYKLLPSHLKCCFAFCALFPKDVPFDKEEIALLWMANDLVQPSSQKVAQNYFEELRSRSFFEMRNNKKYLMHDLINDLARIVSGKFCFRTEDYQLEDLHRSIQGENELPPEVLQFSYLSSPTDTLKRFRGLAQVQGLRTFLPFNTTPYVCSITTLFFTDILPKLRHIRALSLNQRDISVIPNSMGDLKHLRFLKLTVSSIRKLPNDITRCLNLQTLILAHCKGLQELPKDMGLLINLQHLDISGCSGLEELPEDMRLLTNLQHLDIRGVGFNFSGRIESWFSKLEDIQNLSIVVDEIHGSSFEKLGKLQLGELLKISLDNAVTVKMEKYDELKNMMNCIENLTLEWSGIPVCSEDELNIFDKLIPHTNIRKLSIKGYRGTAFPNWLGDSSFCNIKSVTLKDCKNCIHLPPLGQLTGLKRLEISGMNGISEVGKEFYGNSSICKPFQVLEELKFSEMAEWTIWTHSENADFFSLKELRITGCPKLVGDIPFHLTSLRTLEMNGLHSLHYNHEDSFLSSTLQEAKSSNLVTLKKMTHGIEYLEIADCPTISLSLQSCYVKKNCKHVEFPTNDICNSSLESLTLNRCGDSTDVIRLFSFSKLQMLRIMSWESPNIFEFPNGYHQSFTSLQSLEISRCKNVLSFPKGGLPAPNLNQFRVRECNKLKSFPEEMHTQLSSLRLLWITNCPEIMCFPDGGLPPSLEVLAIYSCKKLMELPRNWGLQRLPSLIQFYIGRIEDQLFPEEGLLPASLQELTIRSCPNLEALNHKGLQDITSLQNLEIIDCPELRYLPEDGLAHSLSQLLIHLCPKLRYFPKDGLAPSLSQLHIHLCPMLKVRIEREKGEDWPKVSHIPIIQVDRQLIS